MEDIIAKAKEYCIALLEQSNCKMFPFHNVQHTLEVFQKADIIATRENISKENKELVLLAALFHDVGQVEGYENHELRSATVAEGYLREIGYPTEKITQIKEIIQATRMPQQPKNLLEQIICDADLYHLGTNDFKFWNHALRWEWEKLFGKKYSNEEWQELNVSFLNNHNYHTQSCKQHLCKVKAMNREHLINQSN